MSKQINIFIDNCVLYHSLKNPGDLPEEQKWLKEEIVAIREIIRLKNLEKFKIEHDLNIMIEKNKGGKDREIEEVWGGIVVSPTFLNFQGVMSNPEEIEEGFTKPMRERCEYLKGVLNEDSLDVTHLVHAEFYGSRYFITTDRRLINKANKGNDILKVKVLSPSEFLKELDIN